MPALQVERERLESEGIRLAVRDEEAEVKVKQVETQHLKDDAQKDLEEVRACCVFVCVCVPLVLL